MPALLMVGACYMDTITTVPYYPREDEKLRALSITHRRGGNCPNSLEVFQQFLDYSKTKPSLYLASVLPAESSRGTEQIKASLGPHVKLDHCIYRDAYSEPASSWAVKSQATGSRTLINYNDLPEMTTAEFVGIVEDLMILPYEDWVHFEGRIPEVTIQCMQHIRQQDPSARISVEIEKPGRPGLQELAAEADVVFYAKGWAQASGYKSPEECLRAQAKLTPHAQYLCCTWGEGGAAIMRLSDRKYVSIPAYTVTGSPIVDPIGAGDTFIAGMLFALICHRCDWELSTKLNFANELAGRKVLQEGFSGLAEAVRHYFN